MTSAGLVLYLHGRGDQPTDPPGDLVARAEWPTRLRAPRLDPSWQGRPIADRVADVGGWLQSSALAIGHSFGGWLLLCASVRRLARGRPIPRLVLLNSVLGPGPLTQSDRILAVSSPPRLKTVHRALGVLPGSTPVLPADRLELVQATDDEQCPAALARALQRRYTVRWVPGGHRLEHPRARAIVSAVLERHARSPVWECFDAEPLEDTDA